MPRFTARPSSTLLRAAGTALVAATFLLPRALQAEEVSDEERMGEWDGEGERFGNIVVHGELVASPTAPGGVTLVRTYENMGEEKARVVVEERVMRTDAMVMARVSPAPEAVLVRTQVLELAAHQKKSIGTFLPAEIASSIGKHQRAAKSIEAGIAAGTYDMATPRPFVTFAVDYLRPLAKGEVAARHRSYDMMPGPPPAVPTPGMGLDDDEVADVVKAPPPKPTVRTLRGSVK